MNYIGKEGLIEEYTGEDKLMFIDDLPEWHVKEYRKLITNEDEVNKIKSEIAIVEEIEKPHKHIMSFNDISHNVVFTKYIDGTELILSAIDLIMIINLDLNVIYTFYKTSQKYMNEIKVLHGNKRYLLRPFLLMLNEAEKNAGIPAKNRDAIVNL